MIRDIWKLSDDGDEAEVHFVKQWLAIHTDDALANNDWVRTVLFCGRGTMCPDNSRHTRCCEEYAMAILHPLALEQIICPWCVRRAGGN